MTFPQQKLEAIWVRCAQRAVPRLPGLSSAHLRSSSPVWGLRAQTGKGNHVERVWKHVFQKERETVEHPHDHSQQPTVHSFSGLWRTSSCIILHENWLYWFDSWLLGFQTNLQVSDNRKSYHYPLVPTAYNTIQNKVLVLARVLGTGDCFPFLSGYHPTLSPSPSAPYRSCQGFRWQRQNHLPTYTLPCTPPPTPSSWEWQPVSSCPIFFI